MNVLHWCLFAAYCVARRSEADIATQKAGVGFDLAREYGVVSVYFPNGTFVDVARVNGTESYKYAMSRETAIARETDDRDRVIFRDRLKPRSSSTATIENLDNWERDAVRALIPMLESLVKAAEDCMEEPVRAVVVSWPYPVSISRIQTIQDADSANSIFLLSSHRLSAQSAAVAQDLVTYGPESDWDEHDPKRLTLAIGYSETALDLVLLLDDDGKLTELRDGQNLTLGARRLANLCPSIQKDKCLEPLVSYLRKMTERVTVRQTDWPKVETISHVIIHGESADNELLREAIMRLHKEPGALQGVVVHEANVPPLFSASRGSAEHARAILENMREYLRDDGGNFPPRFKQPFFLHDEL